MKESQSPPFDLELARSPLHLIQVPNRCDYKAGKPPLDMQHIVAIQTKIAQTDDGKKCGGYAAVWYGQIHPALIGSYIGDIGGNLYLHLVVIHAVLKARPSHEGIGFVTRSKQIVALFDGDPVHGRYSTRAAPLAEKVVNMIRKRTGRVQAVYVKMKDVNEDMCRAKVGARRAMKARFQNNKINPWMPGQPQLWTYDTDDLIKPRKKFKKQDIQLMDGSAFSLQHSPQKDQPSNHDTPQQPPQITASIYPPPRGLLTSILHSDAANGPQDLGSSSKDGHTVAVPEIENPSSKAISTFAGPSYDDSSSHISSVVEKEHKKRRSARRGASKAGPSSSKDTSTLAGPDNEASSSTVSSVVENRRRHKKHRSSRRHAELQAVPLAEGVMSTELSVKSVIESIESRINELQPTLKRVREDSQNEEHKTVKGKRFKTGREQEQDGHNEEETATSWIGGITAAFRKIFG